MQASYSKIKNLSGDNRALNLSVGPGAAAQVISQELSLTPAEVPAPIAHNTGEEAFKMARGTATV